MVEDTGKALYVNAYRTLNLPKSVEVKEATSGLPQAVKVAELQTVSDIEERWRIDDEWWRREPVSRLYFSVRLDSGQRLVIYKDLINDCWYRQSC